VAVSAAGADALRRSTLIDRVCSTFAVADIRALGPGPVQNGYRWLQIANLNPPPLERGRLSGLDVRRLPGSFSNLANRLAKSLRSHLIPAAALDPHACRTMQIRLNSF